MKTLKKPDNRSYRVLSQTVKLDSVTGDVQNEDKTKEICILDVPRMVISMAPCVQTVSVPSMTVPFDCAPMLGTLYEYEPVSEAAKAALAWMKDVFHRAKQYINTRKD